MHPPSLYDFVTSKKIIPILLVILLFFILLSYSSFLQQQATKSSVAVIPSPTPVAVGWNIVEKQSYALQYPPGFTQVPSSSTEPASFTYQVSGQTYYFTVFPPGTGSFGVQGYAQPVDFVKTTHVAYGGEPFTRIIWSANGKPFMIGIRPDDPNKLFYSFQMSLPPVNADIYIAIFDKMTASLEVKK